MRQAPPFAGVCDLAVFVAPDPVRAAGMRIGTIRGWDNKRLFYWIRVFVEAGQGPEQHRVRECAALTLRIRGEILTGFIGYPGVFSTNSCGG